jgi:SecD/SecF fusion protein
LKFGLVAVLIAVSLWGTFSKSPKLGIDLRGGTSLTFEIMTNEVEIRKVEDRLAKNGDLLAKATDDKTRKTLQDQIKIDQDQENNLKAAGGESANLAEEIIPLLKDRIDPHGFYNLEMRPLGKNRIEIRMPAADPESKALKDAFASAKDKLDAGNLQRGAIYRVVDSKGPDREAQIRDLSGPDANRADLLTRYADTMDAAAKARADVDRLGAELDKFSAATQPQGRQKELEDEHTKAIDALAKAQSSAEELYAGLQQSNVSSAALVNVLHNYVPPREMAAGGEKALDQRQELFEKGLEKIRSEHPNRLKEIDAVVAAYQAWVQARQRLDDPDDLIRLVRNAGVLEFRIAPEPKPLDGRAADITEEQITRFKAILQDPTESPDSLRRRNDPFLWFPARSGEEFGSGVVTADAQGRTFILLYNQPADMMLQNRSAGGWTLTNAYPTADDRARPAVSFEFNDQGAKLFSEMTSTHLRRPMAILLDDEVVSAPTIQAKISNKGIITGSFTMEEVKQLSSTLKAGSLPAKINPEPISRSTFGPAFGEQNLHAALRAGYWSAVVIVVFMLGYYLLSGAIANVGLTIHLLMVLGTMGAMDLVFTLPGIAGVILVIGMAVDGNVLIYERLREEQLKGQSIRMAIKNAYDRAFVVIFDSNVTTLISAAILGWVGTEEIRGFAITLGLGVAYNVFAAVWVTRWIFELLLQLGWVTKPLKMLHIFPGNRLPKVNWMGLRYYFWAFSIVTSIVGVASFVWQGRDILGIEFSSGTQATVTFKDDALIGGKLPDDGLVREQFDAKAAGHERLAATARVERIDTNRVSDFLRDHDLNGDKKVTLEEWTKQGLSKDYFAKLCAAAKVAGNELTEAELDKVLPAKSYQIATTETDVPLIQRVAADAFGAALAQKQRIDFDLEQGPSSSADANAEKARGILKVDLSTDGRTAITKTLAEKADPRFRADLLDAEGGLLMVVRLKTTTTQTDVKERITDVAFQPDFSKMAENTVKVIGLTPAEQDKYSEFAVLVTPADPSIAANPRAWSELAAGEQKLLEEALHRQEAMVATNFDPAVAGQAQQLAIVATVLAWLGIIVYLWVRFGQFRWGLAAVLCLVHDVTIVVGMVAISGWLHNTWIGHALGIESFKIDLTMVAAVLTIIGYSVNDTIVVFDRIRENRGRLVVVTPEVINASINQTLSRTLLTSATVWSVVLIMYAFGGQGIHAFNYALFVGVTIGTYSSIAVAAPMLLGFHEMVTGHRLAETPIAAK